MTEFEFQTRHSAERVEESADLAPKFGPDGFPPCVTSDVRTGEILGACLRRVIASA